MKKRFLLALLVFPIILFHFPMSAAAETENETSTETDDPFYVYETPPDMREWWSKWYDVPEEILTLDTSELLEAVLQSGKLQSILWLSSTMNVFEDGLRRISDHKGFAELVSRTDFLPTIEAYAREILSRSEDMPAETKNMLMGFKILLRCEAVEALMAGSPDILSDCPYLQRICDSFTTPFTIIESRSDDDITYAPAAIYTTEGNKSAVLLTANREFTEDEINTINSSFDKQYADGLYAPPLKCNCICLS